MPDLAGCRLSVDMMECKDLPTAAVLVLEALPYVDRTPPLWAGPLPASLLWAPDLQEQS